MAKMSLNEVLLTLPENSACVTSILRTYYTWIIVESPDTSWELLPMGLWAWAELAIGIIVGCLPTLPKFFQHIGDKIYGSVSASGPGRGSSPRIDTSKKSVLAKVKRSFAKYGVGPSVFDSWNDTYVPRTQLHDEYVILDGFDASLPKATVFSATTGNPGQGTATARVELEYGQQGI